MATVDELKKALITAHDAGDMEAANLFAGKIKSMQAVSASEPIKPTIEPSVISEFGQGVRHAAKMTGLGLGQLVGLANERDVDNERAKVAAIKDSWPFIAGDVSANAGLILAPGGAAMKWGSKIPRIGEAVATLGKMVTMPEGIIPTIGGGAILGATQPVGKEDSRLANAAIAGAAGGAIPLLAAPVSTAYNLLRTPTKEYANEVVGKTLNRLSTGEGSLVDRIAAANKEPVPGYAPTLAEMLSQNGKSDVGIATLQRIMQSADPYGTKALLANTKQEQDSALLDALNKHILPEENRSSVEAARQRLAGTLYENLPTVPGDSELEKILGTDAGKKAMVKAKQLASNDYRTLGDAMTEYPGQDLHQIQRGLKAVVGSPEIDPVTKRSVGSVLSDYNNHLDTILPELADANSKYARLSRPLNQSDIFSALKDQQSELLRGTANKTLQDNQFLRLLSDKDRLLKKAGDLQGVTSFDKAVTPAGQKTLDNIAETIRTRASSNRDASALGSPTAQNLIGYDTVSNLLSTLGLPEKLASNGAVQSLLERPLGWALKYPEQGIKSRLGEALANPELAALLAKEAKRKGSSGLSQKMLQRAFIPSVSSALYSEQ